jgi:hypothetical protein
MPSYSDVGIRLECGIDWLSGECMHGKIINFMDCLITIAKMYFFIFKHHWKNATKI